MKWIAGIASNIAPTGQTYEEGDPIYDTYWFVTATDERGNVYAGDNIGRDRELGSEDERAAKLRDAEEKLALALNAGLNPAEHQSFGHWRTVYGSDAYIDQEPEMAERERQEDIGGW